MLKTIKDVNVCIVCICVYTRRLLSFAYVLNTPYSEETVQQSIVMVYVKCKVNIV